MARATTKAPKCDTAATYCYMQKTATPTRLLSRISHQGGGISQCQGSHNIIYLLISYYLFNLVAGLDAAACRCCCSVIPKFQINRLQHIQNALARTIVQAPKFEHITLKSLYWLKVSERIEYKIISLTKFSMPLSLRIYMTLYLISFLTVTTHALHLTSLSSNHHHHSKSLIDPSGMLHLIFGTSSVHHSEFLI